MLTDFVESIRTEGLEAILGGLEFADPARSSLVRCVVGSAAFDINSDGVRDEAQFGH